MFTWIFRARHIATWPTSHRYFVAMLAAHNRLLSRAPLATKTASALVLGVGGDALAQRIEHSGECSSSSSAAGTLWCGWYDLERGAAFSSLATFWNGPFMHYYFAALSTRVVSPGLRGLLTKTAITQILLNPLIFMPLFFSWTSAVRGLTLEQTKAKVESEAWPALQTTWLFFTPVNLLNFALIPVPHQNTFNAVASVVYNTMLSLVAGGGV